VSEPYSFRRSVYGYIDRGNIPDLLSQFDMVNSQEPNTKRTTTIVPQQALFLMNSPFATSIAQNVVKRPRSYKRWLPTKIPGRESLRFFRSSFSEPLQKSNLIWRLSFCRRNQRCRERFQRLWPKWERMRKKRLKNKLRRQQLDYSARKPIINEGEIVTRRPCLLGRPWYRR